VFVLLAKQVDDICALLHVKVDGKDSENGIHVSIPMVLDNKEKL